MAVSESIEIHEHRLVKQETTARNGRLVCSSKLLCGYRPILNSLASVVFCGESGNGKRRELAGCRDNYWADGSFSFVSKSFDSIALPDSDCVSSVSISSRAALNSFTALPIPRASSGNFFPPNRRNTIRRITIMSGPAKFRMLAIVGVIGVCR